MSFSNVTFEQLFIYDYIKASWKSRGILRKKKIKDKRLFLNILKTVFKVMMRLFSPHKTTLMFVIRDKTRIPLENLEPVVNLRQRFFHSIALGGLVEVGRRSTVLSKQTDYICCLFSRL
uniref:Uncharacterized protein n=1 Tax=Cucumis melo TaxID=3656 RepID=A0A9I9E8R7_CUCME